MPGVGEERHFGSTVERLPLTVALRKACRAGGIVLLMLRCEECGAESHDHARGWLVLHVRDVEEVDPPFEVVYCPVCAKREFGSSEGVSETSPTTSV